jgi:predicted HAD superfamily hydrolase
MNLDKNYLHTLQKLAETASLITLDVFDTCIHRSVARPVHVFDLVARKWCAREPDHRFLLSRFRMARIQAEAAARKACKEREDIRFAAIYEHLGQSLPLGEAQLKAIADLELRAELDLCYPNPVVKAFYDSCVARGKKVAFISDMYLPGVQIAQMLAKCGFAPDNLFVSSDVGLCKGSGKLFDHALQQLSVADRAAVLHVGDNEQADVRAARKAGLNAFHFDYVQQLDAAIEASSGMSARDEAPFSAAMSFGLVRRRRIEKAAAAGRPHLNDLGYDAFGPALAGWFLWLKRRIAEIAPKKVLLFARDVQLIRRLLAEGVLSFGPVEIEYVYVSRYALSFAAIRVVDDALIEILLRRFKGQTLRKFFGFWCEHSPDRLKEMGFPKGLDPDETICKDLHPALTRFIYENQLPLLCAAREHRDRAALYLARTIKDESTVLIDIGWNGNMQSNWRNVVSTCISRDHVEGLYFALLPGAQPKVDRGNKMEGWCWQPHRIQDGPDMLRSGGMELLELALSADHGTTLGYDSDGRPILADTADDHDYRAAASAIQSGITTFWQDLRALCPEPELALHAGHPDEWTGPLCRLVMKPSAEETELLGDIRHAMEGGKTKPVALAPRISDQQAKPELVMWRPGFAVRNGLFSIF